MPELRLPRLAVIVRTLADVERESMLLRAIDSVQRLTGVETTTIVVVNGDRYCPALLESLYARSDLKVVYLKHASAGAAIVHGRRAVEEEFFTYLDDDDELTGDGIDALLREQAPRDDWDVLVANGLRFVGGVAVPWIVHWERHLSDPLVGLTIENWLSPGNSVFRAASISADMLDPGRDHHEWTYLAYRLLLEGRRVKFVDRCVVHYHDTAASLSKSASHHTEELRLLEDLRGDARLPNEIRQSMDMKYRNLLHMLADWHRRSGQFGQAWLYHVRSLKPPQGFRYLSYTRKLITTRR